MSKHMLLFMCIFLTVMFAVSVVWRFIAMKSVGLSFFQFDSVTQIISFAAIVLEGIIDIILIVLTYMGFHK